MENEKINHDIITAAKQIVLEHDLCDNCLGRFFYKTNKEITNKKLGELIGNQLKIKKVTSKNCWLCEGLIEEIPDFVKIAEDKLKEYEFKTFLIGSKIDENILEKEKKLVELVGDKYAESIKNEINREIGKALEKKLSKTVDFEKPDIMAIVDTCFNTVTLQIASLYIYGRYKKYSREIPQTRWFCKICRGKGCRRCGYTGKLYETSVEELISKKILDATQGDDESFHGAGREDIDVRMLGNGRPFVLEIKNPKIRTFDLTKIEQKINKEHRNMIEVIGLRYSDKAEVERIKKATFNKKYRVVFSCEKPINNEKLKKAVQALPGSKINQLTPSRVAHRRANMVRTKHIYKCDIERIEGTIAVLTLETESGTYIKELVTGDNGRTKPSIAELINTPCKVLELDVTEIKGE